MLVMVLYSLSTYAQSLPSSEIYHHLLQLKETKRVLYVAAHPDDENTRLIATLVNDQHASVAYLSLTRGDGGQNLIGKNLGIELGQIRTQELIKARETDGGQQFFTRAMDFGYSKSPEETLQNWDKETVLSDVVWVVRKFQPDIIITRFNMEGGTHGHHTTSAILANKAFRLAADPKAFPEQLQYVQPWQAKRIFWNTYNFRGDFIPEDGAHYGIFNTGELNPLLGQTYSQIAADSRTMHKSQGFGATAGIGAALDHVLLEQGEGFVDNTFEGVVNRWEQLENGLAIEKLIQHAISNFNFLNPSQNIDALLSIREELFRVESHAAWIKEKKEKIDDLIFNALGLKAEFVTNRELGFAGQNVKGTLVLNNPTAVEISNVSFQVYDQVYSSKPSILSNNEAIRESVDFRISPTEALSQPYWLVNPIQGAVYDVPNQEMIGKPFNDIKFGGTLAFMIKGQTFTRTLPLGYKYNDPVDGEIKQPFTIVPEIAVNVSANNVFILPEVNPTVTITVSFGTQLKEGKLSFEGLQESEFKILSEKSNTEQLNKTYEVVFQLNKNEKRSITASYKTTEGKIYNQTTNRILYQHIPNLTYFSPAEINVIQEDWKVSRSAIAYIPGAGDDVPAVLSSLGYQVTQVNAEELTLAYLSQFKAVVVGIRAYNTNTALVENQDILMNYVKNGGTVVVQYNTTASLMTKDLGPYPFAIGRDRVTVENSPFTADWSHPILSTPNQVTANDFEDWIQERGLYFVTDISTEYSTPLTFQDPGEEPSNGALIYAKYGEGTFIYTGISFFRELPAGVAGATKLFINLIEQ